MSGPIVALLLAQAYYAPTEAQGLFAQGNDAYDKGEFQTARERYESLLSHEQGGADVLYNAGTAALAGGDLGAAVLYLERARRLGGRAEDVEANLAVARSKQLDQVVGGVAEEPFIERVVAATAEGLAAWAFAACWCGAFLCLIALRFVQSGRGWLWALTVVLFVGATPSGALFAAHVYARDNIIDAVVKVPTLAAHELPKDGAKVSFEIHAGLKVRLIERSGNFVKVRLPNGLEGWSSKDGVAEI